MDDVILLTQLNDFIFCPISIYFHNLYGDMDKDLYQGERQIAGTLAHKSVDEKSYKSKKDVITALEVYSEEYRLFGKIDIYDPIAKELQERKKKITVIYDGYRYQLYGQYFCMKEMGYDVRKLSLYSMDDHKMYEIELPEKDLDTFQKFEKLIDDMRSFVMTDFVQNNPSKCNNCIYFTVCDRGVDSD